MTATTSPPQASPELPQGRGAGFLVTLEMEFRKDTIYFIVIDRFFNSCPGNDRMGCDGLFDPSRRHWRQSWGGDLRGVIEKADDLQALGVTALWLSPLFAQVDDLVGGTHRCTATGRAISNASIPTSLLQTTATRWIAPALCASWWTSSMGWASA